MKDATIARLNAELEAARADLAWMQNDRNKWQDSATQRHFRADKAEAERDALVGAAATPPFTFDRYVNGQLMAEGVRIEKKDNLPDAMSDAARLAARGSNGETPVLILTPASATAAYTAAIRAAEVRGMREAAGIAEAMPNRTEKLGGQNFKYIQLGEFVEAALASATAKEDARE